MWIVWFFALMLHATLLQATDIGTSIRIAHCQSTCLRNFSSPSNSCWADDEDNEDNEDKHLNCENVKECWEGCYNILDSSNNLCSDIHRLSPGMKTACLFYRTRGAEKSKYEPSKLPAPMNDEIISMGIHDIAVIIRRNHEGRWSDISHCFTNNVSAIAKPGFWIIVVSEDGTLKHYSWEIWQPKLTFLKSGDPLYQAYITWEDWRAELKQQFSVQKNEYFLEEIWKTKPSFIVTWQQETGDGIMGNQETDSESAYISLPSESKYLVRIATNDGPGSYPIFIETRNNMWTSLRDLKKNILCSINPYVTIFTGFAILFFVIWILSLLKERKHQQVASTLEEGGLTEKKPAEKTEEKKNRKWTSLPISYLHYCDASILYDMMLDNHQAMKWKIIAKSQSTNASTKASTNANADSQQCERELEAVIVKRDSN